MIRQSLGSTARTRLPLLDFISPSQRITSTSPSSVDPNFQNQSEIVWPTTYLSASLHSVPSLSLADPPSSSYSSSSGHYLPSYYSSSQSPATGNPLDLPASLSRAADTTQRRRPKYTRSKTGCMTCRQKKIKVRLVRRARLFSVLMPIVQCDENKPKCHRCAHGQRDVGSLPQDIFPAGLICHSVHLARGS